MRTTRLRLAIVAALAALFTMTGSPPPASAAGGTAAISGTVLTWMEPVSYAAVTVYDAGTDAVLGSAYTDDGGAYLVAGLPARPVRVKASKAGYVADWAGPYTLVAGQTLEQTWNPTVLYLDLTPETVITGSVVQDDQWSGGPPVAKAKVTAVSTAGTTLGSTSTDREGRFSLGLASGGHVRLKVSATGLLTTWAPGPSADPAAYYDVGPAQATDVGVVRLPAPATIIGQVSTGGAPIAGVARVTAFNAGTGATIRSVTTQASGAFRLDGLPPGQVELRARKAGFLDAWSPVIEVQAGVTIGFPPGQAVRLDLIRRGVATGSVCSIEFIDDQGVVSPCVPQGGVGVKIVSAASGKVLATTTTADQTGAFTIGGLPEGRVQVKASAAGWLSSWAPDKGRRADATVFTVSKETPTDVGVVTLYEPAAVYVQVVSNSDPITGTATLTLFDHASGRAVARAETPDGGSITPIGDLRPGTYDLVVAADGYLTSRQGPFVILPGQVLGPDLQSGAFIVELKQAAAIAGTVMGFSVNHDDPLAVKVVVVDADTGAVLGSATSADQDSGHWGEFRIGQLPPDARVKVKAVGSGTWLTSWAPGRRTMAEGDTYTVRSGETTDVGTFAMYGAGTITGQVLSGMDPVAGAKVTVFNADTGTALTSATSDSGGTYRIEGIWTELGVAVKVRAAKAGYIPNWADSDSQRTMATATVFTLGPGQVLEQTWTPTPSLYLDIAREAVIAGQVLADSRPLPGAMVTVFDATTGNALTSVIADDEGNYRIDMLSAWGGRTVKVRGMKEGWRTSWAYRKLTKATADTFVLNPGTVLTWPEERMLLLDLGRTT